MKDKEPTLIKKNNCYFLNSYALQDTTDFTEVFEKIKNIIQQIQEEERKKIVLHMTGIGIGAYNGDMENFFKKLKKISINKISIQFYDPTMIYQENFKNKNGEKITYKNNSFFDQKNFEDNTKIHIICNAGNDRAKIGDGGTFEGALCNNNMNERYLLNTLYVIPTVYIYLNHEDELKIFEYTQKLKSNMREIEKLKKLLESKSTNLPEKELKEQAKELEELEKEIKQLEEELEEELEKKINKLEITKENIKKIKDKLIYKNKIMILVISIISYGFIASLIYIFNKQIKNIFLKLSKINSNNKIKNT